MSDTTVVSTAVTSEVIITRRDEWKAAVETSRKELERLGQETFKLQQQIVALDGAIQACEVLLKEPTTDPNQ